MAGRCGCGGTGCSCKIEAGEGIFVSGIGTEADPFVVRAILAYISQVIQFNDSASIDFTVTGQGSIGDKMIVTAVTKTQRFPPYTTAGRPSAISAGEGAFYFDSDLNMPIWSDGATWRDAAGVAR